MHRCPRSHGSRRDGTVAKVSALALLVLKLGGTPLAQNGTRPPRIRTSSRSQFRSGSDLEQMQPMTRTRGSIRPALIL